VLHENSDVLLTLKVQLAIVDTLTLQGLLGGRIPLRLISYHRYFSNKNK
jgi:hypothetical protein